MGEYIPTVRSVDFQKRFIIEPVKYEVSLERVFVTDVTWCSSDKRISFVVGSGCGEECVCLWAAKVLVVFSVGQHVGRKGSRRCIRRMK